MSRTYKRDHYNLNQPSKSSTVNQQTRHNYSCPRPTSIVKDIMTNQNDNWVQMDLKAKADIILAMTLSELCHAKHCRTSTKVWQKLEEVYHSKAPARKALLWK
ncbi:hypothetical protein ACFW04_014246 [Cataglyphis niger]